MFFFSVATSTSECRSQCSILHFDFGIIILYVNVMKYRRCQLHYIILTCFFYLLLLLLHFTVCLSLLLYGYTVVVRFCFFFGLGFGPRRNERMNNVCMYSAHRKGLSIFYRHFYHFDKSFTF